MTTVYARPTDGDALVPGLGSLRATLVDADGRRVSPFTLTGDLVVETFAQAALVGEGEAARWEMALWPNADGQGDATFWQIEAKGRRSSHTWTVVVPDVESIALSDLLALDAPDWEEAWPTQRGYIDGQLDERVPAVIEGELADQVSDAQQAIGTAGADAAEAVRQQEAASAQAVQQQEAASVQAVQQAGTTETQRVQTAGDTQEQRVQTKGDEQEQRVQEKGDEQNTRLETTGQTEVDRVTNQGTAEVQRVTDAADTREASILALGPGIEGVYPSPFRPAVDPDRYAMLWHPSRNVPVVYDVEGAVWRDLTGTEVQEYAIQPAPSGAIRDAHYPVMGGVRTRTTLLEMSGTNRAHYSQDYTPAYWTKVGVSVAPSLPSPISGTAHRLTEGASSGYHVLRRSGAGSDDSPSIVAVVRAGTRSKVSLGRAGTSLYSAIFDLDAGTVLSTAQCSARIEALGGGWYRIDVDINNITGGWWYGLGLCDDAGAQDYAGDGAGYVDVAHVGYADNLSGFMGSLILTNGGEVTRPADNLVRPSAPPPQPLTIVQRFQDLGGGSTTNAYLSAIGGVLEADSVIVYSQHDGYRLRIRVGGTNYITPGIGVITPGSDVTMHATIGATSATLSAVVYGVARATQTITYPALPAAWTQNEVRPVPSQSTAGAALQSYDVYAGVLTLAEAQAAGRGDLVSYRPGDDLTGWTFSRPGPATFTARNPRLV